MIKITKNNINVNQNKNKKTKNAVFDNKSNIKDYYFKNEDIYEYSDIAGYIYDKNFTATKKINIINSSNSN